MNLNHTPAADLKTGMFVAIVAYKPEADEPEEEETSMFAMWGLSQPKRKTIQYDGLPLLVLAKSHPWICVFDGSRKFALDLRRWYVLKLDRRFVKAMQQTADVSRKQFLVTTGSKDKAAPDKLACPRCGERMVQRMTAGKRDWVLTCPRCGLEGGIVEIPE